MRIYVIRDRFENKEVYTVAAKNAEEAIRKVPKRFKRELKARFKSPLCLIAEPFEQIERAVKSCIKQK